MKENLNTTPARDRLLAALRRETSDRLPMIDLTYWPETLTRWQSEGLPLDADPVDYFGLDRLVCVNDLFEPSFGLPQAELERDDETRVYTDSYGATIKEFLHTYAPPTMIAPGINDDQDWQKRKPLLTPGDDKFNNPAAEREYRRAAAAGHFLAITPAEPVWFVLHLTMGYERGLRAMLREPDLVADMLDTYTNYLLEMLDRTLARGMRFDALWFWSDLCYLNGLLFSPKWARQYALPHWKRLGEWAHAHDMRFIFHCDGNVEQLLPLLLEAGLDAIHPLEARAGNDVRTYKQQYGDRLCLIGNIDADIIATNNPAKIEAEVAAKVPSACIGGGYIYHIDHSVPPTVSLESYKHLLDCVRRHA